MHVYHSILSWDSEFYETSSIDHKSVLWVVWSNNRLSSWFLSPQSIATKRAYCCRGDKSISSFTAFWLNCYQPSIFTQTQLYLCRTVGKILLKKKSKNNIPSLKGSIMLCLFPWWFDKFNSVALKSTKCSTHRWFGCILSKTGKNVILPYSFCLSNRYCFIFSFIANVAIFLK